MFLKNQAWAFDAYGIRLRFFYSYDNNRPALRASIANANGNYGR